MEEEALGDLDPELAGLEDIHVGRHDLLRFFGVEKGLDRYL